MIKKLDNIKFLHLVDHDGTIFDLISPLSKFKDHQVLTSFSKPFKKVMKQINRLSINKEIIVIIHATGNKKRFYKEKEKIIKKFKRIYLFLHVSPKHFIIKNRLKELSNINKLVKKYNIKILTPSRNLIREFSFYGINSISIQVGLNFKPKKKSLIKNRKNIITICTSKERRYQYIKGIDLFIKLIKKLNLEKESIILGDNFNLPNIKSKRLSKKSFLKFLRRSKIYIQLSRTESYNLSAIYAKRMKIPIIVSDIEGHKDNVRYGFRVKNINEAEKILKEILSGNKKFFIKRVLRKNYEDSVKRGNLNNFRDSFNKLLNL